MKSITQLLPENAYAAIVLAALEGCRMGGFDPFNTVEYLQECGAYCDCEVFFNVLSAVDDGECNAWRRANLKVIRGDR